MCRLHYRLREKMCPRPQPTEQGRQVMLTPCRRHTKVLEWRRGEIGRRARFKIWFSKESRGSMPLASTNTSLQEISMSRTRRKVSGRLTRFKDSHLIDLVKRGLVPIPKPRPLKTGMPGIDEIWGPKAKRLAKRLRARYNRRISHEDA